MFPTRLGAPAGMSDRDLAAYEHSMISRQKCRTRAVVLERRLPAAGAHWERIAVTMGCGGRNCLFCFEAQRKRAAERICGNWTQFLTLTLNHWPGMQVYAWRNISRWASELMAAFRKASYEDGKICLCGKDCEKESHPVMTNRDRKLGYAWVVEPTKNDWPHLHIGLTTGYVCYEWLMRKWAEITGMAPRVKKMISVQDEKGICNYLAPYLTKSVWKDWILAVMYRKRLYGTTNRVGREWSGGWIPVDMGKIRWKDGKAVMTDVEWRHSMSIIPVNSKYCLLVEKKEGRYARWVVRCDVSHVLMDWRSREQAEASREAPISGYVFGNDRRIVERSREREKGLYGADNGRRM